MSSKAKIIVAIIILLAGGAVAWQIKRDNDDAQQASQETEEAGKASDLSISLAGLASYCIVAGEQGVTKGLQSRSKAANASYVRKLADYYHRYPDYEYEDGGTFSERIDDEATNLYGCDPELAEDLTDALASP